MLKVLKKITTTIPKDYDNLSTQKDCDKFFKKLYAFHDKLLYWNRFYIALYGNVLVRKVIKDKKVIIYFSVEYDESVFESVKNFVNNK